MSKHCYIKPVVLLFLMTQWSSANAINYFLSARGNDSNKGNSKDHAWCTLKRLEEATMASGDSIFFECGSVFNGQLNISCPGLYFGSFGTGNRPVIRGSTVLKEWTLFRNNVWKTECRECPSVLNNLFIDGKFQPLGRFPNEGYRTASGYSSEKNSISDQSLNFADNYWNDAEIVIRSSRWTVDRLPIKRFVNKTLLISENPSYPPQPGFGYFIQKHLSTLDRHGEWFFDSGSKKLYLYCKTGTNPNQYNIEVSAISTGLSATGVNGLVIENITFDKQNDAGVLLRNCRNIVLNKIEILKSGKNGFEMNNCVNPSVANSRIADSNNNGIECHNCPGETFIYNSIIRTGLHPGRGNSGNGTYIALYLTSGDSVAGNTISNNTIDSVGYSGIDFRTAHTLVKNNLVTNFCIIKDDGAAIYTWNNTGRGNVIEGNMIHDGLGSDEGMGSKDELYASGIYVDDHSSRIVIKNNVVYNCPTAGVFIHNSHHIKLVGNNLYANGNQLGNQENGQLFVKVDDTSASGGGMNLFLDVLGNKLSATSETSHCLFLSMDKKDDAMQIGLFADNQFSSVNPNQAVAQSDHQSGICVVPEALSLEMWQFTSLNDKGSASTVRASKGHFEPRGSDLLNRSTPLSGQDGWMSWPEKSFVEKERTEGQMYSLKANIPGGMKEALVYHNGIHLEKGKIYCITFSIRSLASGKIEFVPLMAKSPWAALGKYACFPVNSVYKKFNYYFRCEKGSAEARINFKGSSTFWIKSITLHEVVENSVAQK